jgi:exodeoxyribonuclease V gamma subunit
VSTLPPLYLHFLGILGRHCRVHMLTMDPAEGYWGDLRTRRKRLPDAPPEDPEWTPRNSLLASMGRQGQDFAELLIDVGFNPIHEDFPENTNSSLLARVQDNIAQLRDFDPGEPLAPDASIQVVSCHGPMREVEVLRDHLLHLFDSLPGLRPRECLCWRPTSTASRPTYMPFSVATAKARRPCPTPSPTVENATRAWSTPSFRCSRWRAAARRRERYCRCSKHPALRLRFAFEEGELETLRRLVGGDGHPLGFDAEQRRELGLPPVPHNTWKAGIDNLLLGTLMLPGDGLCSGMAPYADAEGDLPSLIGRLADAVRALRGSLALVERPRPLRDWATVLRAVVEDVLPVDAETAVERMTLLEAVDDLASHADAAGDAPLDARSILHLLDSRLRQSPVPHGFLGGGVTFAELKPMRSVPSRIICLLGMNEEDFPRRDRPLSFDRIARAPRPGDRSLRLGDRYLFLETLLSAREQLYISYSGQSPHGDAETQPSVVVQELLEHLRPALGAEGAMRLVTRHPLQPFLTRYFARAVTSSAILAVTWRRPEPVSPSPRPLPPRSTHRDRKRPSCHSTTCCASSPERPHISSGSDWASACPTSRSSRRTTSRKYLTGWSCTNWGRTCWNASWMGGRQGRSPSSGRAANSPGARRDSRSTATWSCACGASANSCRPACRALPDRSTAANSTSRAATRATACASPPRGRSTAGLWITACPSCG